MADPHSVAEHIDIWAPLVLQAQQHDSEQMNRLIDEFENVVQAACRRFTVPHCERADLLQDAYVGFLIAVYTFDPTRGVTFARYAKSKTQEAAWQYIRKRNRTLRREWAEGDKQGGDEDSATSLLERVPDENSAAEFSELEWRSLLASLSEREMLVVERIVIDGLSMADLARLEGVSPGTVKTWKQRAFLKIREEIKKTRD